MKLDIFVEEKTNYFSSLQIKKSLQALLEEANNKKVHLEVLNDRCEVLMDYSAHTPIRDMTVQLQASYTNALTNLQVCCLHRQYKFQSCILSFVHLSFYIMIKNVQSNEYSITAPCFMVNHHL